MDPPPGLTLLLVGKTGHGKSATGNTILGRKDAFHSSRSLASITGDCALEVGTLPDGRAVQVIDTPGTCDSSQLLEGNLRRISEFVQANAPGGIHGFIVVLSSSDRFTAEERLALERLASFLGDRVWKHAVLCFTRGAELQEDAVTLDELLATAPDTLKEVLDRAGGRAVLFENKRAGGPLAAAQVWGLVGSVDEALAASGGKPHTGGDMAAAAAAAAADPLTAYLGKMDQLRMGMQGGAGAPSLSALQGDVESLFASIGVPLPGGGGGPGALMALLGSEKKARPLAAFSLAPDDGSPGGLEVELEGEGHVEGSGRVEMGTRGELAAGEPGGAAGADELRAEGAVRVRGDVDFSSDPGAVSLFGPLSMAGPGGLACDVIISDNDWLGDQVYKARVEPLCPGADATTVTVRGVAPGERLKFELRLGEGASLEVPAGGELAVRGRARCRGGGAAGGEGAGWGLALAPGGRLRLEGYARCRPSGEGIGVDFGGAATFRPGARAPWDQPPK